MKKVINALMCAALLLAMSNFSVGKLVEYDLNTMIDLSTIIVVGEVKNLQGLSTTGSYRKGVAIIKIDQLVKGIHDHKEIAVTYTTGDFSEDASFAIGARYLLFLEKDDTDRFRVVQGYTGCITIRGNEASVHYIRGEKGSRQLNDLISKITGIVKDRPTK